MKRTFTVALGTLLGAMVLSAGITGETAFAEADVPAAGNLYIEDTEAGEIVPGTNMYDAAMLPLGTKAYGTMEGHMPVWFAFTTGETAGETYNVTAVNTSGQNYLSMCVFDEYGTEMGDWVRAASDGIPATISSSDLAPNTTYYICVKNPDSDHRDCTVIVKRPDEQAVNKVAVNFSEVPGFSDAVDGELYGGANQSTSTLLPRDTKAYGTMEGHMPVWFAFTTGETAGETYNVTAVNTSGQNYLSMCVFDEYGTEMGDWVRANSDGIPVTISSSDLAPDTTYYICVKNPDSDHRDCVVIVRYPEEAAVEEVTEAEDTTRGEIDLASLSDSLGDDVDIDALSDSELEALAETQSNILHDLQRSFDDAGINVDIDESTGRVTMDNSILFAYDDATLSDVGKTYLDGFIDVYTSVILNASYSDAISHIQIEGHTDSDGSYAYNQTLSEKRAASVAEYCISRDSRLAEVITTKGRSYDDLVYNDDGTVNMTASRRVVFRFILDTSQQN